MTKEESLTEASRIVAASINDKETLVHETLSKELMVLFAAKDQRIADLEAALTERTQQVDMLMGKEDAVHAGAQAALSAIRQMEDLQAQVKREIGIAITAQRLADERTQERNALAAALDAIQANCVAGSADPRPGVARSSIIRIGEICGEQDYAPRLADYRTQVEREVRKAGETK